MTLSQASTVCYQALFEESPVGIQVYADSGQLLAANPASLALFGVTCLADLEKFNLFSDGRMKAIDREKLLRGETLRYEMEFDFDQIRAMGGSRTQRAGRMTLEIVFSSLSGQCSMGATPAGYQAILQDVSERKNSEAVLRKTERQQRQIRERLDIAMQAANLTWWDLNLSQDFLFPSGEEANPLEAFTDYTLSETALENRIHPEDLPELVRRINEHIAEKTGGFESVHRLRQPNGAWAWALSRGRVSERDEPSRPQHLLGITMDITALKKIEEDLQTERDFARLVLDTMGQGLTITGPENAFQYVNPAYCQMTGYRLEDLLGKSPFEIAYTPDLEVIRQAQAARLRGETTHYEIRLVCKDGSLKPVLVSNAPYLRGGRIEATVSVVTDQSEQKQFQEALQREEERYRIMADFTKNWEYWQAPDGHYLYISPACESISGYSRQAFLDDPNLFARILLPEDQPVLQAHLAELNSSIESIHSVELRIRSANGETVYIGHTSQPIYSPDGVYLGRRGTNEDITSRKQSDTQMIYLSSHDCLTGLNNRAYFEAQLERMNGGRLYPISILIADVDELKRINDTLGHAAGDQLIIHTARLINQAFRQDDIIARIGGDEFAVLLPHTGPGTALECLARLQELLTRSAQVSPELTLSVSLGIATGEEGADLHKLQIQADQSMYADKSAKHKPR